MLITVLQSKLAYVKVTQAELFYEGSITIDSEWMDSLGLVTNQQVHVVNVNNGKRFVTYVIPGESGSKTICLNGPAARNGEIGDEIIVLSYATIDPEKETLEPKILNYLKQ
jgi:aspartate 1-decarboxylase